MISEIVALLECVPCLDRDEADSEPQAAIMRFELFVKRADGSTDEIEVEFDEDLDVGYSSFKIIRPADSPT